MSPMKHFILLASLENTIKRASTALENVTEPLNPIFSMRGPSNSRGRDMYIFPQFKYVERAKGVAVN